MITITRDYIPSGSINRPGTANACTSITIHDTANKEKGANAAAHADYIKTITDQTSWHYTVDDKEAFQHLPDEEKSFHTSSKEANETSIAIELCVNEDGDFEATKRNAVELVRELMKKHDIPIECVFTHNYWTGKNCPATLLGDGWADFLADIVEEAEVTETLPEEEETTEQSRWKSLPLWGSILAVIYLVAKEWFGIDIPGWQGISTEILAALAIVFGSANNPKNKNGF